MENKEAMIGEEDVASALWRCIVADMPWDRVTDMNREVCRSRARAAISAHLAALERAGLLHRWQPIDTAPRDGSTVLVARWDNGHPTVYSDHWSEAAECWCDSSGSFLPTHWQPLPAPPPQNSDEVKP